MMINIHIPLNDLNNWKKLILETIIIMISMTKYRPLKSKEVDHMWNWKKIPTMNKIMRNILFLASK